ncbi:MAG: cobamide remodeling phosphodiesterase CbiR [Desulfobacter sp.]
MGSGLKKRPFRLGTTSFIYPDHILPNVRKTGRFFDEIELLVFESQPRDVLPTPADVMELNALGKALDLTYNVHMPVDVSLAAASSLERQRAADTLALVMERFSPLAPTSHTLHLDMDRRISGPEEISAWEDRARKGLDLWVPHLDDPTAVSVETLWYDPVILSGIIEDYNLSACLDLGHHFKYGYDLCESIDRYKGRVPLVHLHGVDFESPGKDGMPKDHIGLDRLPGELFGRVAAFLETYTGTVSLEVFGLVHLESSLKALAGEFSDIPRLS